MTIKSEPIVVKASATPIIALGVVFAVLAALADAMFLFERLPLDRCITVTVFIGVMFVIVAVAMASSSLVLDATTLRQRGWLARTKVDLADVTAVAVGTFFGDLVVLELHRGNKPPVQFALGPFAKNAVPLIDELQRRFPGG